MAFVGLAVPHVARALVGPDYRWIVPYSVVLGAVLLLCRRHRSGACVARPAELGVGIVTALVGAPFFIWLVRRRNLVSAVSRRVARPAGGGASLRLDLRAGRGHRRAGGARPAGRRRQRRRSGEFAIPLADVIRSLVGAGDRATDFIVLELRLPRALTGLLAGAAFGLAGADLPGRSRATRSSRPTSSASPAARRWRASS